MKEVGIDDIEMDAETVGRTERSEYPNIVFERGIVRISV
jgi:hypothetical protein